MEGFNVQVICLTIYMNVRYTLPKLSLTLKQTFKMYMNASVLINVWKYLLESCVHSGFEICRLQLHTLFVRIQNNYFYIKDTDISEFKNKALHLIHTKLPMYLMKGFILYLTDTYVLALQAG